MTGVAGGMMPCSWVSLMTPSGVTWLTVYAWSPSGRLMAKSK